MNNIILTLLCVSVFGISCADEAQFASNLRKSATRNSNLDNSPEDSALESADAEESQIDEEKRKVEDKMPEQVAPAPLPPTSGEEDIPLGEGESAAFIKLGVNYEDGSDYDYNDAVICLNGKFKVNHSTGEITSAVDQWVYVDNRRNSDNEQTIGIYGENGRQIFKHTYPHGGNYRDQLVFRKGEKVQIHFTTTGRNPVQAPSNKVQILNDQCNE